MSRLDDIRDAAKASLGKTESTLEGGTTKSGAVILPGPQLGEIIKEEYSAFGVAEHQELRLLIYARCFFMMPQYRLLQDVFFDGAGEYLGLIFEHQTISVHGRRLLPVATALCTNSLQWLKEFDPLIHLDVLDPNAALVTQIEITGRGQQDFPFLRDGSPAGASHG